MHQSKDFMVQNKSSLSLNRFPEAKTVKADCSAPVQPLAFQSWTNQFITGQETTRNLLLAGPPVFRPLSTWGQC